MKLFAAMRLDKKVTGGEIKFVLAQRIGKVVWGRRVPEATIQQLLLPESRTQNPSRETEMT